jgi:chitinase
MPYVIGGFQKFNNLRKINPNLKTLVAIGGWNEGSTKFSTVANSASLRTKFVTNLFNFVRDKGFNGLDLDWEYPSQRGGIAADKVKNTLPYLKHLQISRQIS